MKKWKIKILLTLCVMILAFWGNHSAGKAEAARGFNLLQTVSQQQTQKGRWVKTIKGNRFRYTATKKYARNSWLKIKKNIYFFDQKGYSVSGMRRYKGAWYYLDGEGRLRTGWQKINGQKYYFSKRNAERLKGWNKVGSRKFYFNSRGILQTNQWVKDTYIGEKGCEVKAKRIFVGDSRTMELKAVMRRQKKPNDAYVAKYGRGYKWFSGEGVQLLKKELRANPYSTVLMNLGVNDLHNRDHYIALYQRLVQAYPKARFYFVSVNPLEEKLLVKAGYSLDTRDNVRIEAFNAKLQETFPLTYIDSYSYLLRRGYVADTPDGTGTVDGLHYTVPVYQRIYRFVTAKAI